MVEFFVEAVVFKVTWPPLNIGFAKSKVGDFEDVT